MKRLIAAACFAGAALALTANAQAPVSRVASDALVIDRVAEASNRDLPAGLLTRIVEEDIEILRGRRPDGSYEYANYERFEAGRVTQDFSIQPRNDQMETVEVRGSNVYRVIVDVPSRRMLVRRNRPVWIERIDVEYVPQGSAAVQTRSFEVKAWLQPGEVRPVDLPEIARQATAKVVATVEKGGYGNVEVALVQARIVDRADSPYAGAVTSAKSLLRALEDSDATAVRTHARRMHDALGGSTPTTTVAAVPSGTQMTVTPSDNATRIELQAELQLIEDLLTGTEAERRDGLDRLHQLIRRLRP